VRLASSSIGVLKTRVAVSWVMEMIFSKDLEQMLTLRDVELISRMGTSLRSDVAN